MNVLLRILKIVGLVAALMAGLDLAPATDVATETPAPTSTATPTRVPPVCTSDTDLHRFRYIGWQQPMAV